MYAIWQELILHTIMLFVLFLYIVSCISEGCIYNSIERDKCPLYTYVWTLYGAVCSKYTQLCMFPRFSRTIESTEGPLPHYMRMIDSGLIKQDPFQYRAATILQVYRSVYMYICIYIMFLRRLTQRQHVCVYILSLSFTHFYSKPLNTFVTIHPSKERH